MTYKNKLLGLKKLKKNYLDYICFADDLKDISNEFSDEISRVCVEIQRIESMPIAVFEQKIKYLTKHYKSKL